MEAASSSISERARRGASTTAQPDAQDGLFDRVVENDVLSAALEKREEARRKAAKEKGRADEAHDTAKGMIDALALEEGETVRCGRFRIKKGTAGEPSEISFTRSAKPRLTITLLD